MFSDELRHALKNQPVSIYRISKETGIDKSTLSRFLSGGKLTMPKIDILMKHLQLTIKRRSPCS